MSSEEKVKLIQEIMEQSRQRKIADRFQVLKLYSEIENDLSVVTPNLSGICGYFVF